MENTENCPYCNAPMTEKTVEVEGKDFTFFLCSKQCHNAYEIYLERSDKLLIKCMKEDWKHIKKELATLPAYEEGEDTPNIYFCWSWIDQGWHWSDICLSDYYPHGFTSDWGIWVYPVDKHTLRRDLIDVAATESLLYEFIPEELKVILLAEK